VKNFIVSKKVEGAEINYLLVEDSLEALQLWAMYHRQQFDYPVVGITGSNGKTIVKEWLTTLLEYHFQVVKSPMSYNSQIGVPFSLLQLSPNDEVAIIEAGISQVGEMERLAAMIQPTLGVMTHFGSAHAEGFESEEQKLAEKSLLFEEVQLVLTGHEQSDVSDFLSKKGLNIKTTAGLEEVNFQVQFPDNAARENASLAMLAARELGLSIEDIQARLPLLHPVEMRSEIITDNPEITILNDSYNADIDSIRNALQTLSTLEAHPNKIIIITDLLHQGQDQIAIQQEILQEAENLLGVDQVWTIGPVFYELREKQKFLQTENFLQHFDYQQFRHSTILLKGSRVFGIERLIPFLNRRPNATYLQLDLNKLTHNLRYLKGKVRDTVKIMCMVKAFSYGSGTWEIAKILEEEGVEYLGVAYPSEGIELREKGITLPILINHPDPSAMGAMLQYDLEPLIYDFRLLEAFLRAARLHSTTPYKIHLKFDTGMGRLGFTQKAVPQLIQTLSQYPDLQVVSMMSHLAAAEMERETDFSQTQILQFAGICNQFQQELGISPLRHILNTSGVFRFPEAAMDMVRLGIGLYGINPTTEPHQLAEVASLHSVVSQIHEYPTGTSIGYGRTQYTTRPSRIATIPIGYADGIFRNLSNGKTAFLVKGKLAPTFGRICMDTLMIDVTDIPEAQAGDEVVIFGEQAGRQRSIKQLAEDAETIPYEVMTSISPRVRRVYVREG
jgi:alanine racemase